MTDEHQQVCVLYEVRPGSEREYDALHRAVFPEVVAELKAAGFHDYSIFRSGSTVVAVYRAPFEALTAGTNASTSDAQQRWSRLVTPLFVASDSGPIARQADLVFRLD